MPISHHVINFVYATGCDPSGPVAKSEALSDFSSLSRGEFVAVSRPTPLPFATAGIDCEEADLRDVRRRQGLLNYVM